MSNSIFVVVVDVVVDVVFNVVVKFPRQFKSVQTTKLDEVFR